MTTKTRRPSKSKRKMVKPLKPQMMLRLRRRAKMIRCGRKRTRPNTRPKTALINSFTAKNNRRTQNNRTMLKIMVNLPSSLMMRRRMVKKTSKRILH